MALISRKTTGLRDRTGIALYKRTPAQVKLTVYHYDGGETPKTEKRELELLKTYDNYHAGKGWGGIGYNLAVGPVTGNVYEARGLDRVGAHTTGYNTDGIGIVLIGGNDALTAAAKRGLREAQKIAEGWAGKYLEAYGHRDFAQTSCPGDNLYKWIWDAGLRNDEVEEVAKNYIIKQGVKVAPGTYAAYEKLRAAFKKATGYDLLITSGLRTYAEQKSLYDRWKAGTFYAPSVSPPGTSLHESGRALDLRDSGSSAGVTVAGNSRSNWMRTNSIKYGFAANGYSFGEPWHFEYQGDPWGSGNYAPAVNYNPNNYSSAYIKDVQQRLIKASYSVGKSGADGILGKDTFDAIKTFQKTNKLTQDGIPGPATLAKLKSLTSAGTGSGTTSTSKTAKIKAIQAAVKADQDGIVGPDTRKRVDTVRKASVWGGSKFPYGVAYAQKVVGTTADGIWGTNSGKAHDKTVKAIQKAVGATQDVIWGQDTDKKVRSLVS